jgi:hypothetical protein
VPSAPSDKTVSLASAIPASSEMVPGGWDTGAPPELEHASDKTEPRPTTPSRRESARINARPRPGARAAGRARHLVIRLAEATMIRLRSTGRCSRLAWLEELHRPARWWGRRPYSHRPLRLRKSSNLRSDPRSTGFRRMNRIHRRTRARPSPSPCPAPVSSASQISSPKLGLVLETTPGLTSSRMPSSNPPHDDGSTMGNPRDRAGGR